MIVRGLSNFGIPEWMRVTMGLPAENARYLELMAQAKSQGIF
jgi:histidinol-phosphate aminotransferase